MDWDPWLGAKAKQGIEGAVGRPHMVSMVSFALALIFCSWQWCPLQGSSAISIIIITIIIIIVTLRP